MNNGFNRRNFSNFMADHKRASRHMLHTCKLAEQNDIAPEALASVCLEVAAELMTRTSNPVVALETLQLTLDRIEQNQQETPQVEQRHLACVN